MEEFLAELLRDPEIRKEYEALKPKYEEITELLKQVEFLKNENKELNRAVAHLTELLNLSEIEAAAEFI